jgi:hypothetical protein
MVTHERSATDEGATSRCMRGRDRDHRGGVRQPTRPRPRRLRLLGRRCAVVARIACVAAGVIVSGVPRLTASVRTRVTLGVRSEHRRGNRGCTREGSLEHVAAGTDCGAHVSRERLDRSTTPNLGRQLRFGRRPARRRRGVRPSNQAVDEAARGSHQRTYADGQRLDRQRAFRVGWQRV